MTSADLRLSFFPSVRYPIYTSAALYARPKLSYLLGPFYDYYLSELRRFASFDKGGFDLTKWLPDWQCHDFVSTYLVLLQASFAISPVTDPGATMVAAGRWDFHPDKNTPLENHSIVAAFTDQGLTLIDPQNNQQWIPTSAEIFSTRLALF